MIHFSKYLYHKYELIGKKKIDNTIYSFDIETTSFLILNNKQISASDYLKLKDKEKEECIYMSTMYIWTLSINDLVYYGRTWEDLIIFLQKINTISPNVKIFYVHNLSFEFQFLKSVINFENVMARKKHKVMQCETPEFNIIWKCTYFMTNCALNQLPKIFKLNVKKMVGDLDYSLIRHSNTPLNEKELKYCENDCLVIYEYIKRELETYNELKNIPITSTGKVRRELKNRIANDYNYKNKVKKAINTDPHIYNLLIEAFAGGYTHSNWIYTDEILNNITSWDFTSSYPYILATHKFPSTIFSKCNIKKVNQMSKSFAYILIVKLKNLKCKYYNNFISQSKARNIKNGLYDNGRIIQAEELEITLTDIDFYFILKAYDCQYTILECYFSKYNYLPKQLIEFVLEKYVNKTQFKNIKGKELEYMKEKNKFNAIFRYVCY